MSSFAYSELNNGRAETGGNGEWFTGFPSEL